MTANDVLDLLLRTTLAGSSAIALALLLRWPVRTVFGANAAWQLWLVGPAAMLAAALPSLRVQQQLFVAIAAPFQSVTGSAPLHTPAVFSWTAVLLGTWLCGAALTAIAFGRAQQRFTASLGTLTPRDGLWYAQGVAEGPVLLGLRAPKVVVPADFESRYDAFEQALIIEHERRHAARADPWANAVIALLRCLFWFNPLMHIAAARWRFDQELACDADVMQRIPGRTKAYAAAMLKTQTGVAAALATCQWQSSHPLKERIMNLNQRQPASHRRIAGRLALGVLLAASAGSAALARADVAAPKTTYSVAMTIEAAGKVVTPRLQVREGENFKVLSEDYPGHSIGGDFTVTGAGADSVLVKMKLAVDKVPVGEPSIVAKLGDTASVTAGGSDEAKRYKITLRITVVEAGKPGA